jgi:hypothetical protein
MLQKSHNNEHTQTDTQYLPRLLTKPLIRGIYHYDQHTDVQYTYQH